MGEEVARGRKDKWSLGHEINKPPSEVVNRTDSCEMSHVEEVSRHVFELRVLRVRG